MRFAYADPPYFGMCNRYAHNHPDGTLGDILDGRCWDDLTTHALLIGKLTLDFDGWALSLTSTTLWPILPLCPDDVRIAAWVKPFASWKPGVNPAYAWEPVIFWGGRKRNRDIDTVRDWHSEPITLQRGLVGAKPPGFCRWVLDLLGYQDNDEFVDLFPGAGSMGRVLDQRRLPYG